MKKRKNTLNKIAFAVVAIWVVGVATFSLCMAFNEAQTTTEENSAIVTAEAVFYDVPIDIDLFEYILGLCADYDIPVEIVLAMIEVESSYKADAVSKVGAKGLMQVIPEQHEDRMIKLNCPNLFDPYQNVTVGMNYLSELIDRYDGNFHKALTAYHHGPTGAKDKFFGQGTYQTEYSLKVLEIAEKIEKGMIKMNWTDDPVRDHDRYQEEQNKWLEKMPVCSICDEYIQDDYLYEINDEVICEECLKDNFRKNVEDYIE